MAPDTDKHSLDLFSMEPNNLGETTQPVKPDNAALPGDIAVATTTLVEAQEMEDEEEFLTDIPLMDDGRTPIADYAERAYLAYAMSVVRSRALPGVQDGQKPVQRRILYSMMRMGLDSRVKHVKSARVVGDVIGKLHPHGDSSVYDAMVRMSQDFTLRYPLVDGQGNFGSRDGDAPAAMRYTEARLTKYADLLLSEIDLGTVGFIPNYDGQFSEPEVLPSRLPMLLLNGASGIAVGMATDIPSHNLVEVANACLLLIRNPSASFEEVLSVLPGPDFAGGSQLIASPEDVAKSYLTGYGGLRVRARWTVEQLARSQWQAVVTELPPGVSATSILEEIEALTNPQVKKGKKALTPEQLALKTLVLSVLDSVGNDSDAEHPIRLVFQPRTSKVTADELMNVLLAHTGLERNIKFNLVSLGLNGKPQQKGLMDILREWIEFRYSTVTRRTETRLAQVDRRIHILEGRHTVFLNVEEVIQVIREADDPKADLMSRFGLSEIQAEDILEIRLRQLAKLEGFKIETELNELRTERVSLVAILSDRSVMTGLILEEIESDRDKYGDLRRTLILPAEKVTLGDVASASDDPVTVVVSRNGWLRARSGHGVDLANVGFKVGDSLLCSIETRASDVLAIFDNSGRCYNVQVATLPNGRGDGAPLTSLVDIQAGGRLQHILALRAEADYLVASTSGYGFICKGGDLLTRQRAGKAFMTLEASESMLRPVQVLGDSVAVLSSSGRMLVFPVGEVKVMPKGKGVILMDIGAKEEMISMSLVTAAGVVVGDAAGKERVIADDDLAKYQLHRARKGCLIAGKTKPVTVRAAVAAGE